MNEDELGGELQPTEESQIPGGFLRAKRPRIGGSHLLEQVIFCLLKSPTHQERSFLRLTHAGEILGTRYERTPEGRTAYNINLRTYNEDGSLTRAQQAIAGNYAIDYDQNELKLRAFKNKTTRGIIGGLAIAGIGSLLAMSGNNPDAEVSNYIYLSTAAITLGAVSIAYNLFKRSNTPEVFLPPIYPYSDSAEISKELK